MPNTFPPCVIEDEMTRFKGMAYLAKMDMPDAFGQTTVHADSRHILAIATPTSKIWPVGVPFGPKNVPA